METPLKITPGLVIPAQAGIQFFRTWVPAWEGRMLILIWPGGPEAYDNHPK